jgi:TPP-dependent pyruvate/acetoin dehydrogenase alpha subunit
MSVPVPTEPINITGVKPELLLRMFQKMLEAREFEEQLYYLFLTTEMPGTMHQATGQEAVPVGIVSALADDDYVTSTHRGHAHCIAKDVPLEGMMAEMFAKREGICHGMGGSMHLADFSRGMLGAFAIVGAGIPIATGAALSAKVRNSGQVAVSFFGDGGVNEGTFHEALNMAALWKLPVIFVIENNQYALSMTVAESSALANLSARAAAYNMPGVRIDGNDVVAVYRAAQEAVSLARSGGGPTLIEAVTYRIRGHARFEASAYRDKAEVTKWEAADPIERLGQALLAEAVATKAELDAIRQEAETAVSEAINYAQGCTDVGPEDFLAYILDETGGSHA